MAWTWPKIPRKDEFVLRPGRGFSRSSEVTELDYQASQAMLTRDAPFGTEDTPHMKEKIVGGRYVSVLERPYGQNVPRYEKLSLVSDKPNHVDPRALTDFSRRYNKPYQDSYSYPGSPQQYAGSSPQQYAGRASFQQDPFSKNPMMQRPAVPLKRPDSKDISTRYPTLPPIEENRLKNNQISTVFEPEAWTSQYRVGDNKENHAFPRTVFNSRDADRTNGYRPLYDPRGSGIEGSRQSDPGVEMRKSYDAAMSQRNQPGAPMGKDDFVKKLTSMLPKNVFLPERPLQLSENDEVKLLEVLAEELSGYNPLRLRDIYLDIVNTSDKNIRGFCHYKDLYYSLSRQMLHVPGDLLQITAAMFVSPDRADRDVNYEKFLSFIGLALKQAESSKANAKPRTPVGQQVENYFADSEQAKLVSTLEQQLHENDFSIDFNKLEMELTLADRLGKGYLPLKTITDVCYQLNIPLQSSVLNRVLQKCRFNSYDDRYSWRRFLDILGQAQPPQTRTEPVRIQPQRQRSPSPQPQQRYTPQQTQQNGPVSPLWRRHEYKQRNTNRNYDQGDQDDVGSRADVISRMDQDIKKLERNYQEISGQLKHRDDTPWFKNFMEFADALYKLDQKHEGNLPAEDVYRWSKMYNEAGNLGMEDYEISRALTDATKLSKVNIHSFLTRLGNVANHEMIV